jgi:nucleoid DNA-binding protein
MAQAKNKTQPTKASVEEHIAGINENRKVDCQKIIEIMTEESGCEPVMWGAIVGFGTYHYKYESGREGEFMRTGFANRKTALTLYIMAGFDTYPDLMSKLGKFKTGKSCLYIKKLEDVDTDVLRRLIRESLDYMAVTYGKEPSH